jgi:dTMP kinase
MYIVIEGPDASGKTTQVNRLAKHLDAEIVPGCSDSPIGKLIRRALGAHTIDRLDPLQMQAAYTADRFARDHALRTTRLGKSLVGDRWTMSALVYGVLHLETKTAIAAHRDWLMRINKPILVPDLYIRLRVRPETLLNRLVARGGATEVYERTDLIGRVVELYESATNHIGAPCMVLNGEKTANEIEEEIRRVVERI